MEKMIATKSYDSKVLLIICLLCWWKIEHVVISIIYVFSFFLSPPQYWLYFREIKDIIQCIKLRLYGWWEVILIFHNTHSDTISFVISICQAIWRKQRRSWTRALLTHSQPSFDIKKKDKTMKKLVERKKKNLSMPNCRWQKRDQERLWSEPQYNCEWSQAAKWSWSCILSVDCGEQGGWRWLEVGTNCREVLHKTETRSLLETVDWAAATQYIFVCLVLDNAGMSWAVFWWKMLLKLCSDANLSWTTGW